MDNFPLMRKMSKMHNKSKWKAFEHFLWGELQQLPIMQAFKVQSDESKKQTPHFLLALSGGADSVALLRALTAIQASAKIRISAMYVHHGESLDAELSSYRNSCEIFCRKLCADNNIVFQVSEKPSQILKSEETLRDFRYQQLFAYQCKIKAQALVTAHHQDDLLETRLLRLIRGTGTDGLISMQVWQSMSLDENQVNFLWRPLLKTSKQKLLLYLDEIAIGYIDDPSNASSDYLRNWLRNEWLPQLELKAAGSVNSLARSLGLIAESLHQAQSPADKILPIELCEQNNCSRRGALAPLYYENPSADFHNKKRYFVNRIDLMTLSLIERKQCIVKLLKRANVNNISHGQVNEILKQLDNSQKMHRFTLRNCVWVVDAERVSVELK